MYVVSQLNKFNIAKQSQRQDAAMVDTSADWKSFRHGAIKLKSWFRVLVERYKDGK